MIDLRIKIVLGILCLFVGCQSFGYEINGNNVIQTPNGGTRIELSNPMPLSSGNNIGSAMPEFLPQKSSNIVEPDFGPYMRELQRSIKANWNPPIDYRTKRVTVLFKIEKSGSLANCSVFQSSGNKAADKAAIDAVYKTAPFRPLPQEFSGNSIDIQFTFDYNVFGASRDIYKYSR